MLGPLRTVLNKPEWCLFPHDMDAEYGTHPERSWA